MDRHVATMLCWSSPPGLLDGFHSKSRLCVTCIRKFVRAIAPRLKRASYGRQAIENAACSKRSAAERADPVRCCPNRTSGGFRKISTQAANKMGARMVAITETVQGQI